MDDTLRAFMRDTLDTFIRLHNERDLPGILALFHETSFAREPLQHLLMGLFARYELRYSLLGSRCIAVDGNYAFVVMTMCTERLTGPEFPDNTAESLVVFQYLDGKWKIWTQTPLALRAHG